MGGANSVRNIELLSEVGELKTIFEFRILHDGWEMDNRGWITENEHGIKTLMGTSHGGVKKMTIKEVHEKMHETRKSLAGLKQALKIMST